MSATTRRRLRRQATAIGWRLILDPERAWLTITAVVYGFAATAFIAGVLVGWWLT